MTDFRFQHPWWLLMLVPLWLAILVTARREKRGAIWYSSTVLLASLPITWAQIVRRGLPWLRFCGLGRGPHVPQGQRPGGEKGSVRFGPVRLGSIQPRTTPSDVIRANAAVYIIFVMNCLVRQNDRSHRLLRKFGS